MCIMHAALIFVCYSFEIHTMTTISTPDDPWSCTIVSQSTGISDITLPLANRSSLIVWEANFIWINIRV